MRPTTRQLAGLLLLGLAPGPALAAAPPPAPAPAGQPVDKGAVVSVDLSRLPERVARRGTALCLGSRITGTGTREEVRCERPFGYDAPVAGEPLVLVFQPSVEGRPTRVEIPYRRDPRPRIFTAPAAGTVRTERVITPSAAPPAAKGDARVVAPAGPPPDQAEQAKAAAVAACIDCRGAPAFALQGFTVEAVPPTAQEIVISIRPPAP